MRGRGGAAQTLTYITGNGLETVGRGCTEGLTHIMGNHGRRLCCRTGSARKRTTFRQSISRQTSSTSICGRPIPCASRASGCLNKWPSYVYCLLRAKRTQKSFMTHYHWERLCSVLDG